MIVDVLKGCWGVLIVVVKLQNYQAPGKFGGYLGNYYMICRNEVENMLGFLGKRKKEWKWMGVDD